MLGRKLSRQIVRVIALVDENVITLALSDLDRQSQNFPSMGLSVGS